MLVSSSAFHGLSAATGWLRNRIALASTSTVLLCDDADHVVVIACMCFSHQSFKYRLGNQCSSFPITLCPMQTKSHRRLLLLFMVLLPGSRQRSVSQGHPTACPNGVRAEQFPMVSQVKSPRYCCNDGGNQLGNRDVANRPLYNVCPSAES